MQAIPGWGGRLELKTGEDGGLISMTDLGWLKGKSARQRIYKVVTECVRHGLHWIWAAKADAAPHHLQPLVMSNLPSCRLLICSFCFKTGEATIETWTRGNGNRCCAFSNRHLVR